MAAVLLSTALLCSGARCTVLQHHDMLTLSEENLTSSENCLHVVLCLSRRFSPQMVRRKVLAWTCQGQWSRAYGEESASTNSGLMLSALLCAGARVPLQAASAPAPTSSLPNADLIFIVSANMV